MSASAHEGSDGALVRRPRLFEALQRGTAGPVTLVTGPAGSGKTVLVRSWVRAGVFAQSGAWITVERGERDGLRFWGSVLEELRASGVATRAPGLRTLAVAPRGPVDELVRRLAESIDRLTDPALLVLDDVQHLEAQDALEALAWMLARAPPALRVILIGRREPQVGAHRLRVAGALTEIGEPELRFTREEARELFARASVSLSDESLDRLHARTEGWAAGLRLAAIGLTGLDDTRRFVSEFSGSERTVADYLMAEVLAAQPPEVRQLLLRTCVLERINGPLANLLAGVRDGERLLQELEEAGALVNSVDSDRSWFRYHHLLSDLLRLELRREAPEEVASLHRKAARWYARHGFAVEAIRHAQAGGDWDHAGDLLTEHWFSLFLDGRQATIQGLLKALPAKRVHSDAELAAVAAADHLAAGQLEDVDSYLAVAKRLAGSVPKPRRRRFEVTLAVVKLTRARSRGDFEATVEGARAMLTRADGETWADVVSNADLRALALMNLGFVEFWALRLEDSERHLKEGLALAEEIGRPYVTLGCLGPLAHLANMEPRPDVGEERSRRAIELADQLGWSEDPIAGTAYLALGGGLISRGRLQEGESWLDRAEQVLEGLPDPEASVSLPYVRGVLRFQQQRHKEAIEWFRNAVARPRGGVPAPHFLSTSARAWELRARVRLGDLGPARSALAEADEAERGLVDWRNLAACLHLAEDKPKEAVEALAPVLDGSATAMHVNLEVEALVLEAIARDRLGQAAAAEEALEGALDLAGPERQVWTIFTVSGARSLLQRQPHHRTVHRALIAELLERFTRIETAGRSEGAAELREPLTDRELEVLRFLPTHLSAREIADELSVSVHTVKTHMRSIYGKLDVHRRSEAVEHALALELLPR